MLSKIVDMYYAQIHACYMYTHLYMFKIQSYINISKTEVYPIKNKQ